MHLKTYTRKPFLVDAVRVDKDNLLEVAQWCKGEVHSNSERVGANTYIKVDVPNPQTSRQTKAFIGDWVLKAGKGFKVYTDRAFTTCFETQEEPTVEELQAIVDDSVIL